MTQEERDYAIFELAHVRGLIAEAAVGAAPTDEATCRLLIAVATRLVVGALLHQAQRWPVGWRQTLPALRALDADAAALAERTLTAPGAAAVDATFSLLDRAERALGGPLRPGLDQLC